MLVARETTERDAQRSSVGFNIGETVQVVSLGRVGTISGRNGTKWLVTLVEGDAPVQCETSDLSPRKTLLG